MWKTGNPADWLILESICEVKTTLKEEVGVLSMYHDAVATPMEIQFSVKVKQNFKLSGLEGGV